MRLFLALPLPDEVRSGLEAVLASWRDALPGWRFVRSGGIHVTLRFLGEIEPRRLAAAEPSWKEAAARSPVLRFRIAGTGAFPSERAPRVLWAGIEGIEPEGSLASLAASLEAGAIAAGAPRETRAFRPHLTLARAARGAQPGIPPSEELPGWKVEADEVVLYRSELLPGGARHTALSRFPLGASRA